MKKFVALLICLVTLVAASVSAQGKELKNISETDSANLTVKIYYPSSGVNAIVKDGSVEGLLPDGTDFSVEGLPTSTHNVLIHPIEESEEEVHDWMEDNIGEDLDIFRAYYVAAENEKGETVPHTGAEITLQLPDAEEKTSITLCYLDTDGKARTEQIPVKNGTVSFVTDHSSYYIFCTPNKNPGTSDLQMTACLLAAAAALITVTLLIGMKKKKANA